MNNFLLAISICGTICLTGCFSIEKAKVPDGKTQIIASNYGWYLFDRFPLACGDCDDDWIVPTSFFHDRVTMDEIQTKLMEKTSKQGKTVKNLAWHNDDSILMIVPILNVPVPIPYIITYREMQLSGELE